MSGYGARFLLFLSEEPTSERLLATAVDDFDAYTSLMRRDGQNTTIRPAEEEAHMELDEIKLKAMAMSSWMNGGMDSLVKVFPKGYIPIPGQPIGYCTQFKFLAGRTPEEMEPMVGFGANTKLSAGAEIFVVNPLPKLHEFALRGYSHLPDGKPTPPDFRVDPRDPYPPGLGAPQWQLLFHDQSHLTWLASLNLGQRFQYMSARLPRPICSV